MTNKAEIDRKLEKRKQELEADARAKMDRDIASILLTKEEGNELLRCFPPKRRTEYHFILLCGDGRTPQEAERNIRLEAYAKGVEVVSDYEIGVNSTAEAEPFVRACGEGIVPVKTYGQTIREAIEGE